MGNPGKPRFWNNLVASAGRRRFQRRAWPLAAWSALILSIAVGVVVLAGPGARGGEDSSRPEAADQEAASEGQGPSAENPPDASTPKLEATPTVSQTEFFDAVAEGEYAKVKAWLRADENLVHLRDGQSDTALHIAVRLGEAGIVDRLLEANANPNARNHLGRTPLHIAAEYGRDEIVAALAADPDSNLDAKDNFGRTARDINGDPRLHAILDAAAKEKSAHWRAEEVLYFLPVGMRAPLLRAYFGFELWRLLLAVLVLVLAVATSTVSRYYINRYIRRDRIEGGVDKYHKSFFELMLNAGRRALWVAIWALAIRLVGPILSAEYAKGAVWLWDALLSVAVAVLVWDMVEVAEYYFLQYASKTETKLDDMLVPVFRKALRVLVVVLITIHLYQSFTDQSITTLLAGISIMGMAVALAAQDTLKNLFGFLMIVLDRPYTVGERINYNGHDGVIEEVGLRSTRMRRLDGHVVTIPNSETANTAIHNIGRRPNIRRVMNIGLTYDTPPEKIEEAVRILQNLLDGHEGYDPELPPRVYFQDFGDWSLNIIVIYWYHPPEYWDYMAHAQKLNLAIMRNFAEKGIDFAFPSQTIYVAGDDARRLTLQHQDLGAILNPSTMPPGMGNGE